MIAVKEFNPELDIRFYFPYDNKLRKSSKTRYSDWCRKNGFPFYVGKVPKIWRKLDDRDSSNDRTVDSGDQEGLAGVRRTNL